MNWKAKADKAWADLIKLMAGYKSEYSGKAGKQIGGDYILNAHHILGKKNFALRYSIINGICLTSGEHCFIAHGNNLQKRKFDKFIGEERLNRLEELSNVTMKANYKDKYYELLETLNLLIQQKNKFLNY